MPTITIILNIVFCAGIVLAIVGLCAWGIVTDRPFAAYLTNRSIARSGRLPERRGAPREESGYRGPRRSALDVGA